MTEPTPPVVEPARSPGLRDFELNPFRVLRLAVNVSTNDAALQADSVLTLARLGLPPEEEDPLPWLPAAERHHLQRAAQAVQEPLVRLKLQLLWFDGVRDRRAGVLAGALRDLRGPALQQYVREEWKLGKDKTAKSRGAADPARIAHALNQANLRLLLAASVVSGAAPAPPDGGVAAKTIAPGQWRKRHGLTVLLGAHDLLAGNTVAIAAAEIRTHWSGGLQRWLRILSNPGFRIYLETCIADLGDDFAGVDDVETLEASIRTHLADISAREARFLLLEGRCQQAESVVAAAAGSGLEARLLAPAMRPLRHVFQSELVELRPLLERSGKDELEAIDTYVRHLAAIRERWLAIDSGETIGLLELVDEAVEQVYLRLRNRVQPAGRLDELLRHSGEIAKAQSLRTRIAAAREELAQMRAWFCHFCRSELPEVETAVVLEAHRETHREQLYNATRIHYQVRRKLLRRCARCARFHGLLERMTNRLMLGAVLAVVGIGFVAGSLLQEVSGLLVIPGIVAAVVVAANCQNLLTRLLTPQGHSRYGTYQDSEEVRALAAEGFSVAKVNWSANAVASIAKG